MEAAIENDIHDFDLREGDEDGTSIVNVAWIQRRLTLCFKLSRDLDFEEGVKMSLVYQKSYCLINSLIRIYLNTKVLAVVTSTTISFTSNSNLSYYYYLITYYTYTCNEVKRYTTIQISNIESSLHIQSYLSYWKTLTKE